MWYHNDTWAESAYFVYGESISGVNSNFQHINIDEFFMNIRTNFWAFNHIKDVRYNYKLSGNKNWYNKKAIKILFEGRERGR